MANIRLGILLILAGGGLSGAARADAARPAETPPTKEEADDFEKRIRPILVKHCYECHSGDPKKAKSNFVLDTRDGLRKGGQSGPVIIPGNPDDSPLIEAVRYQGLEMPPREKLPDETIDELVKWIERGAPDPRIGKAAHAKNKIDLSEAGKFWAFQRPQAVSVPSVADSAWPRSDIDRFVQAAREKEKLQPVADADRVTLIRRLTFDLVGLPPTPDEIDAFLSDSSSSAIETVVDRLLGSPRFGEKWGRHWLDVVRFGESTGKERNIPFRYAWRYRNYVIDAFNEDKPYDCFIVEQLAGDLLTSKNAAEHDQHLIATGFLAVGTKGVNTREPEQYKYDVIDDQIDVTSRAFLGMTVACARCHDHKFDPIPTSDYYAMAGIFRSTDTYAGVKPGSKTASDKSLLTLSQPGSTQNGASKRTTKALAEHEERQQEIEKIEARLAELRKSVREAMRQAQMKKKKKNKPPIQPVANPVDQKAVREQIRKLEDRLQQLEEAVTPAGDFVMGVGEGEPRNSPLLNRGELKDRGDEVPRGVLSIIKSPAGDVNPRHSGRLELAHWIAAPENPLTARVMVNRVWQHLFGEGLVASTDNFGALGEEPSHPELLDYLALQFVDNDKWSVKRLIRSIVLSRTYQMSSEHDSSSYERDPSNKSLWRMERRRLDAEEIRDALLAAAGDLDLERPEGSPLLDLPNGQLKGGRGLGEVRKATNVRSVYLPVVRNNVPEMLQVFDAADPSLVIGKRDVTTVPTQALYLLNNAFVMKQAEQLASRVLDPRGLSPAERVDRAYRLALGRLPSEREKSDVLRYLHEYRKSLEDAGTKGNGQTAAWASFCQALFASGEFRYVY